MRRIVLDTCILVAAFRSRHGASAAILGLVADSRLRPLATTALFLEYEDVLLRPEQRWATGMSARQVEGALAALAAVKEPVDVHFVWRPQLRDPADEMVLDAAVNGRADALVTHNVADFASAATRFGLNVLSPGRLLTIIRA
jgi:putative PIN family toxin of toxin-antitoxin system